jgi:hypothetical protein
MALSNRRSRQAALPATAEPAGTSMEDTVGYPSMPDERPAPQPRAGDISLPTPRLKVTSVPEFLLRNLAEIAPGKANWSAFQAICGDIFSFLFCPPLAQPIVESSNLTGVNRRDLVFPNYATSGPWDYMRSVYQAQFVVVDAKNYVDNIEKKEVLQLANYLSEHGTGLFGIIISRNGAAKSAEVTLREQWVAYQKLLLILNDDDMRHMISMRADGTDPADLIRQKIEHFRLSI